MSRKMMMAGPLTGVLALSPAAADKQVPAAQFSPPSYIGAPPFRSLSVAAGGNVFFDERRDRIYVSCGEGAVDVVQHRRRRRVSSGFLRITFGGSLTRRHTRRRLALDCQDELIVFPGHLRGALFARRIRAEPPHFLIALVVANLGAIKKAAL